MIYAQLRTQIHDGDVIAFRGSLRKPGNLLIAAVTRSRYTHTGTAIWMGDRLMVSEMKMDGNHFVFLSSYATTDFDVFPCPGDREAYRRFALDFGASHRGYAFTDLLLLAGRELCNQHPLPSETDHALVCSGLTYLECAASADWERRTRVTPKDVATRLGNASIQFRGTHGLS